VVSTRKYRHILLKGTHYKKLKSYQFFFEGNVKQLESKVFQGQSYMKASVVPSMKKKPLHNCCGAFTTERYFASGMHVSAGLGLSRKGKCNHVGGVLFAIEDFTRRGLQRHAEPLSCPSRLSLWVVPRNQSVAAKPLDQVLIRKIRFGKKNIRLQSKVIKFDPRSPNQRTREENSFKILSESLQNCLPASSFFLFHDIKSNCVEVPLPSAAQFVFCHPR